MKLKTSELTGPALDWAVAQAEGALHPLGNVMIVDGEYLLITVGGDPDYGDTRVSFAPSTDWSQGGPIVVRGRIDIQFCVDLRDRNRAYVWAIMDGRRYHGYAPGHDQPLIAAMRCYVASKLGEEVEVPEELC